VFDGDGYWLRARWVAGSFRVPPIVGRVALNTVWARHAATRRGEVLGSGTGAPDQRLKLVATPVLAGERIEVRERDAVGEREVAALREELGDDGVTVERDAEGTLRALWVRWTPVTHFHGSGPADRHYVLDATTGELRFGDGLAGRAPPQGRANIRAAVYATGGGVRGNLPAGAVSELKSVIAYIAGVTNLDAASGGSGREDDARVRARGPRRLRHRDRAVTAADLADLAFEAAPEVARAHVLTSPFNPIDVAVDLGAPGAGVRDARGWVTDEAVPEDTSDVARRTAGVRVVVVAHGDVDQPTPSIGLLEQVEAHLIERAPPAMRVHVSGPRWIRVAVRAEVVAAATAAADRMVSELRAAITRFIHPLTGGELEQGWDFGRIPRRSHFYRLLARFPGVHHIQRLDVITDPPLPAANEPLTIAQRDALAGALVYSGAHELILVAPAEDP
jgi:predicted phage baseplate assembly protein